MVIFFISLGFVAIAQTNLYTITTTQRKATYVELIGTNIGAGINFDIRQKKGVNDGFGFRAGISIGSLRPLVKSMVTTPLGINYIHGKNKHGYIFGVGLLPTFLTYSTAETISLGQFGGQELLIPFPLPQKEFQLNMYGEIGYRYTPNPNEQGFMFQITLNPIIAKEVGISAGIAFGYVF
jgi:hypothetical protein